MKRLTYFPALDNVFAALLMSGLLFNCSSAKEKVIDYFGQELPGLTAQLFAPGVVSTDSFEHSAPAFSPAGDVVLWTVVNKSYHAYMLEMRFRNGKWSAPYNPSFADSTADDYYPCFSPDGKKLYFSSRRKLPSGYTEGGDIRLWEVERNGNGWGNPVPFDTLVAGGQEYAHSIAKNGTVYFSSPHGGGTSLNIHKSGKTHGAYTKPSLLPYNINSVGYEDGPCIAPDERFLVFESQRPEGIEGSCDLYISFKIQGGHWSIPVNMGPKINSAGTERFARLSPDGKYLFFGSNRNQSASNWGFDIFWIDARVIDELRSHESAKIAIDPSIGEGLINALYRNDVEGSAVLLKQWLSKYSNSLDAVTIFSSTLRKQKRYVEAEQLLTNIPSQWNKNSSVIMEMALVKFGINKDEEAVTILAPILADKDQLRERYIYLSGSLLDMRKLKASDEYFEKAMAISPSSFPYYNRGSTLARMGEKDKAFEALNKAADHGGYSVKKDYEDDANLQSLKSDPRWQALIKKLK
jgi:Tol biopolymer transport system component